MKNIIKFFKEIGVKNNILFLVLLCSSVLINMLYSYIPILNKKFIDDLSINKLSMNIIGLIILIILFQHVVSAVIFYISTGVWFKSFRIISENSLKNIYLKKYKEFMQKDPVMYGISLYRDGKIGAELVYGYTIEAVSKVLRIFFVIGFVFTLDTTMFLAMILYFFLNICFIFKGNKYFYYGYDDLFINPDRKIVAEMADILKGHKEIKTFMAYGSEKENINRKLKAYEKSLLGFRIKDYFLSFFSLNMLKNLLIAFSIYRGIASGQPGTFFALTGYAIMISDIVTDSVYEAYDRIRESIIRLKKIEEL